jgi:hypothetical protein
MGPVGSGKKAKNCAYLPGSPLSLLKNLPRRFTEQK